MSYASVADVEARLGRYGGLIADAQTTQHPNEDDVTAILADVSAEIDLALVARGFDPDDFSDRVKAGLKDLAAFGTLMRVLAGVPADPDLEKMTGFCRDVWTSAMGDPASRQPDAIKGSITLGTHPVVRALVAGTDEGGSGALAGNFWDDEPGYGWPDTYWNAVYGNLPPGQAPAFAKGMRA